MNVEHKFLPNSSQRRNGGDTPFSPSQTSAVTRQTTGKSDFVCHLSSLAEQQHRWDDYGDDEADLIWLLLMKLKVYVLPNSFCVGYSPTNPNDRQKLVTANIYGFEIPLGRQFMPPFVFRGWLLVNARNLINCGRNRDGFDVSIRQTGGNSLLVGIN